MSDNDHKLSLPQSGSGLPWHSMPATNGLHVDIGRVVTSWSLIDRAVNEYIEAFLTHTRRDEPHWKGQDFRRRKKLFVQLLSECFPPGREIHSFLSSLIEEAHLVSRKRNFLVHGMLEIRIFKPEDKKPMDVRCTLIRRGEPDQLELTATEITALSFDMGFLAGKLARFDDIQPQDWLLTSQERSKLRAFLTANR